ncbi:hypothetical protein HUJ05_010386 [Dendroctonus ponderosae]|nr:hypothetical protein HUJ05_010386 [Dendroctonus ponderosae]
MMLPLPKWAAQVRALVEFQRGTISVSGIKGQKEHANPLASPPPAATSPRISQHHAPRPPSPLLHVPPPASPPPRPPSMSSNSSDSDGVTGSPSLEERIKSLDEKYEKWSGSRAFSATGNDPLALLDASLEKFRSRHKLLEIQDLKEVQPSEIVKSVMAKRSVFDEDLKRLESVGEKYEPKDFGLFCRLPAISTQPISLSSAVSNPNTTALVAVVASSLKLSTSVSTQLPKTPTMLSPRSSGTPLPISASRGLQYPFPSHPPMPMSPAPTTSPIVTSFSTPPVTTLSTSVTVRNPSLGENRLKSTVNVPGESRTSSVKNRSVAPVVSDVSSAGKPKPSEKISLRRNSCSTSPRADVKTRRNSDTSARRIEDGEKSKIEEQKLVDKTKEEFEKHRKEQEEKERLENERIEKEKLERERREKERLERESELDKQRLEEDRLEKERIQREAIERERAKEQETERERIRQEKEAIARLEKESQEKEKLERERVEADKREKEEYLRREREERENQEREERDLKEKLERELKESERREKEEREQKAKEDHRSAKEKERRRSEDRVNNRNKDSDNHHERSSKHRENHSELKHRENNTHPSEKHQQENQPSTKESKDIKSTRDDSLRKDNANQDLQRREVYQENVNKHENSKAQFERDAERRKESIKENRDNNIHDRVKYLNNDVSDRAILETRHMSLDLDLKNQVEVNKDPNRRKERNNSLPTHVGIKRRISVQDGLEMPEDAKRSKLSEFKRVSERRDSRDSIKSDDRSKKPKHKNNSMPNYDKHSSSKEGEDKRKDKDREDKHKHRHKLEKQKSKSKSKEKEGRELHQSPVEAPANNISMNDKDFLATFNLRSNEEIEQEKQEKQKREALREKRNKDTTDADKRSEEKKSEDRTKKDKPASLEIKDLLRSPQEDKQRFDKIHKKDRIRKLTNSSDSDSDEPKKHSIFDIVDDGPPYISMYDKVKARSCKNMQKQEEEKRQEKIKAKFSQLKLSRARREEKKRSNSWDEDSDSDKDTEIKCRRGRKLLDSSDESEDHKTSYKQKDTIYSDSDNSLRHSFRHIKMEPTETTDEDIKLKQQPLRCSKSKITSDSSEEDYQRHPTNNKLPSIDYHENATDKPKASLFENDTEGELEIKPEKLTSVKTELERLVKKERRNSKFQEFTSPEQQSFDVLHSQSSEVKIDRFNSRSLFDNTSDDDFPEVKKEKSEKREKKHKKKQKKQKHSLSNEESGKLEFESESPGAQERKHHDKKKDHSKKDRKRDKLKDSRDKPKKAKKSKSENKSETKRDGKMENIFGSLSEDSEAGIKLQKSEFRPDEFRPDENAQPAQLYNNDSDKEQLKIQEEKDREAEHKKRKEKKRREKERRFQEAAAEAAAAAAEEPPNSNDNSMDFADMCKQLEANIKDDAPEGNYNTEISSSNLETSDTFNEADKDVKKEKEDRKEGKEKKKKRKKSKDEKRHHHHHHHHEKNKVKTPEVKHEISESPLIINLSDIKIEPGVATEREVPSTPPSSHSQSLPNLDDIQSPTTEKSPPKFDKVVVNPSVNSLQNSSLGTSKTKRDKQSKIPGFGTEIDEVIHENAVKSISGIIKPEVKVEEPLVQTDVTEELLADSSQDKTRVVISQEETEDAVAALLGESFGGCQFEERYDEDITVTTELVVPELVEEPNVQDDEEMRKAVQSLEVEGEISKPDTPQSEHELQIDTDTEEPDESTQAADQTAKTVELFQNTKKIPAAIPVCSGSNKVTSPLAFKSLSSPPSLSPIKSEPSSEADQKPMKPAECINVLVEREQQPQQTVISQTWSGERKEVVLSKPVLAENPTAKPAITVVDVPAQSQVVQPQIKQFVAAPPTIKINEPLYPPLAKLSPLVNQKTITTAPSVVQPSTSSVVAIQQSRHNLPARLPDPTCKPVAPEASNSPALSRLPITPVIVTKPLQPATIYLPQPIVAHSSEPPKLISTAELRQERPRMIFHPSGMQPYKAFAPGQPARMLVQGDIRHFPPNAHFVPSRQINPSAYGQYMGLHSPPPFVPLQLLKKESQIRTEPDSKPADQHANSNSIKTTAAVTAPHLILTDIRSAPNSLAVKSPPPVTSKAIVIPPSSPRRSPSTLAVINAEAPSVSGAASSSPERRSPSVPVADIPAPAESVPEIDTLQVPAVQNRTSSPNPVLVPNPEPIVAVQLPVSKIPTEASAADKEQAPAVKPEKDLMEVPKAQPPPQLDAAKPRPELGESAPCPSPAKDPTVKAEEPTTVPRTTQKDPEVQPANLAAHALAEKVTKEQETLEAKEDNEFWSAKDSVNIESVIQTLGSADEMSDSDHNQAAAEPKSSKKEPEPVELAEHDDDASVADMKVDEDAENEPADIENDPKTETSVTRSSARRGRGGRPRANNKVAKPTLERGGIQTRRGKQKEAAQGAAAVPNIKRGRGGKVRSERKSSKSESDSTTNDVYEFREDSDDCNKEQRPRLVLTIKSTTSSTSNAQTTTIVKEITKDGAKEIGKEVKDTVQPKVKEKDSAKEVQEAFHSPPNPEPKDEFTSPQTSNTRKSRRLAEKDVFRNTVDDTIEDVIKNTPLTRAAANQRRSGRQQKKLPVVVQEPDPPRKSPRGRKPNRRVSESTENSSSEDLKEENTKPVAAAPLPPAPIAVPSKPKVEVATTKPVEPIPPEATKEKKVDHCSLKTVMLKRFKGEMNANKPEPTKLIDPVTGMLIPMRESEEGKYIPLPGTLLADKKPNAVPSVVSDLCLEAKANDNAKMQPSVIAQSHPVTVVQQSTPKIHTLKAHVLNSQAAKAVVTDLAPSNKTSVLHNPVSQPRDNVLQFASPSSIMGTKCSTPVHIAKCGTPGSSSVPAAANLQGGVGPLSPRPGAPVAEVKPQVKAPMHSPGQDLKLANERHLLQARDHLTEHDVHPLNSHLDFVKQQAKSANKVMSKPVHSNLLQQHMPAQISNHPVSKALRNEQIHHGKGVIENSKIDVNMPMMLGRPNLSPSGQQPRLSGGLPVPTYEASLMADARAYYNRSSPPPAHQNSPHSPKGEPLTHFPALRPNLIQTHYIHPQHMMYQQFLRQQQHFQRTVNMEKPGEDGEDTSVSLALSGRGAAVPHHSPHNRATESPAIGQVYNPLTTRLPPYHPGTRFFEPQQPAEPPPAHRPLTSHDRAGLAHIPQLASSDRSLASHGPPHSSAHLISDRPTGIIQARPHSTTHLGAGERSQPSPYGAGLFSRFLNDNNDRASASSQPQHKFHFTPRCMETELSGLVNTNLGASGTLMGPAKHMGPDSPVGQRLGNLIAGPAKLIGADAPLTQRIIRMSTPPSPTPASQNLYEALEPYVMKWQGLLALKTDQAAVQMYLISGNEEVAKSSLPKNEDGSTPPLRIFQRMRMEPMQIEGVVRKMQTEKEHCILVALPCGLNTEDVLKQSQNLITLINYLQQKQAAGIINVAYPGTTHPPAYVVHIFPSSDFVNQNLRRLAPTLLDRIVANDTSHLLIVITTV